MENFDMIKKLVGSSVTEDDLKFTDCFVRPQLGLFIPAAGPCGYAQKKDHTHPSYIAVIFFDEKSDGQYHYPAQITSPDIPHSDAAGRHYYCILIDKDYFESRFKMYSEAVPVYKEHSFEICSDILKSLNLFAFEYSKHMANSDVTLDAQSEIITHWIIRSIFGESLDMRAVSDDYSVARAQHYMERHFSENITVAQLAGLGYISPSSFARRFKKETGITPIEYLIGIRINRAKLLLKRKELSMTEIAYRCGFGSSAYFSSRFQEMLGVTPTEYRDKYID